jgi:lipopolysaccharide/colanic/teichoic acid biosynthesis glycosyltransferase
MSNSIQATEEHIAHQTHAGTASAPPLSKVARYHLLKRSLDLTICVLALIFCLPIMLVIALCIKVDSRGPVLFTQKRVGARTDFRNGEMEITNYLFKMYKFRTMYHKVDDGCHRDFIQAYIANDRARMAELQKGSADDANQYKLVGDPRVTPVGRILRKLSLDELPQIFNVIVGDMSLVGPRPPIPYEVELYQPWHYQRLQAKPGITGYWQVIARSSCDFDEMVRLDIEYIKHQSLWLDLKILLLTPLVVLKGDGAV